MGFAANNKKIDQGKNIRLARHWKGIKQDDLAYRLNMAQSQISLLETQDEIDEDMLERIALALDVPVDFLKNFEPEKAMKTLTFTNQEAINATDNTNSQIVQEGEQENNNTYNTYHPLDKVSELYERIVELKVQLSNAEIKNTLLQREIKNLRKEIESLKK